MTASYVTQGFNPSKYSPACADSTKRAKKKSRMKRLFFFALFVLKRSTCLLIAVFQARGLQ